MSKKRGFLGGSSDPDSSPSEGDKAPEAPEATPVTSPAGAPPAKAEVPLQLVALDVYCATSGRKPDQNKAFMSWARGQKLAYLPMAEWAVKWEQFQNRPV